MRFVLRIRPGESEGMHVIPPGDRKGRPYGLYLKVYSDSMARTLDTTELEAQQQELLSEMEVLNGMIQQMIQQNATVAQDQTEYNQRFDALSQKFKEAEAKKDAVAQQISDIRDRRGTMEDFLRILKQQDGEVTAFSEKTLVRPAGLRHSLR